MSNLGIVALLLCLEENGVTEAHAPSEQACRDAGQYFRTASIVILLRSRCSHYAVLRDVHTLKQMDKHPWKKLLQYVLDVNLLSECHLSM